MIPREVQLALGRIFLLGSRPTQPGDVEQYEAARAVVLAHFPADMPIDHAPNWVRDRNKGAQGD
jgi:hypothetical protein